MAESATRTESVRMYVISPTGPSAPTSMPSYSCCAIRIVTAAEKPSCFAASCCSVLVRNGGGAGRRRSPFSTSLTLKGSLSASTTRSEEHTSELQSLPTISYAVFCLKKKKTKNTTPTPTTQHTTTK